MVSTGSGVDRRSLGSRWKPDAPLVVVSFCAGWCTTCAEFRQVFEHVAMQRPDVDFVWLDIESDHDICGDIDVESFPTLAVFRGDVPVHFGVSIPQAAIVMRLVDELALHAVCAQEVPEGILALPEAFRSGRSNAPA